LTQVVTQDPPSTPGVPASCSGRPESTTVPASVPVSWPPSLLPELEPEDEPLEPLELLPEELPEELVEPLEEVDPVLEELPELLVDEPPLVDPLELELDPLELFELPELELLLPEVEPLDELEDPLEELLEVLELDPLLPVLPLEDPEELSRTLTGPASSPELSLTVGMTEDDRPQAMVKQVAEDSRVTIKRFLRICFDFLIYLEEKVTSNSTRRLRSRPSWFLLSAAGRSTPKLFTVKRLASTP
jgi:hypothetical protein